MSPRITYRAQLVLAASLREHVKSGLSLGQAAKKLHATTRGAHQSHFLVVLSQAEDEEGIERFQGGIGEYIGPGKAAILVAGHRSGRLPEALHSWGEVARQEGALWPQWHAPLALFYGICAVWLIGFRAWMMINDGEIPDSVAGLHLLPGMIQSILIVALVVVTSLVLCFRLGPNYPRFYRMVEGFWWHFPRLGPALRQLDKVRLLRMLAWGAETGQPLEQTLRIAAGGLQSPRLRASIESASISAQTGASFSEVVGTLRLFSRMEKGVFAVGEEAADLPRMLGAQAESATDELERLIQKTQKGVTLFAYVFMLLPFVSLALVGVLEFL